MKKIIRTVCAQIGILLAIVVFFPMTTFAAGGICASMPNTLHIEDTNTSFGDVLNYMTCMIEGSVIPLMFSIATVVFLYGVVKFIKEEKAEDKEKGRMFMIWGIVAFAVMFSVWGLVGMLENTFGVANVIPQIPVSTSP